MVMNNLNVKGSSTFKTFPKNTAYRGSFICLLNGGHHGQVNGSVARERSGTSNQAKPPKDPLEFC
jgi:hypothetical protein